PMDILMGNRHFRPIYEAALEHGLPVGIHGGSESAGVNGPILTGQPTYYFEVHSGLVQLAWAHLSSLVVEGTFVRYPDLKFVIQEMGYAWLPSWMWRMDKEWKSLRTEAPWLERPPSEYMLEHVRFTSQPIEEPPKREYHQQILEMMHGRDVLMFSTDYPHWDFDDPRHCF
ncbi:MAG: amidohydrolase family protein, partial [Gemmatimonas sp.]|nr:amidohydrolase family protein [Gemmatimonas sp.]